MWVWNCLATKNIKHLILLFQFTLIKYEKKNFLNLQFIICQIKTSFQIEKSYKVHTYIVLIMSKLIMKCNHSVEYN